MRYEDNNRYQFQPRYVKVYRQVRYKPAALLGFVVALLRWLMIGAPTFRPYFDTRRKVVSHVWMEWQSYAAMNMGHYYSTEELIAELRGKCRKPLS